MSTLHKVKAYFGMAPMDDYDDEYYDDVDAPAPRRAPVEDRRYPVVASGSPMMPSTATTSPATAPVARPGTPTRTASCRVMRRRVNSTVRHRVWALCGVAPRLAARLPWTPPCRDLR